MPSPEERALPFEWAGKGRCINCGFLAFSQDVDLTSAREVSIRRRAYPHGSDPNRPDPLPGWWHCFIYAEDLIAEMGELEAQGVPGDQRQRQIIEKDRNCQKFYTYVPGQPPPWHYQDRDMWQLEEMRKANALKIAELEQSSRDAQIEIMKAQQAIAEATRQVSEDHKQISAEHKQRFEKSDRQNVLFQIAFMVLAGLTLVLALLPLAYPNGLEWLVDHAPNAVHESVPRTVVPLAPTPESP